MKIKVYCTDDEHFQDYYDVISKYSITQTRVKKDKEYEYPYTDIEVNSLEFLPKLEQDLLDIRDSIEGLIFRNIRENYYKIEIYNGYRE